MRLTVVMCVYNEINTVLEILKRVQAVPLEKEIIVVDDHSTDGTTEVLATVKENNVKVLTNKENKGKGFCIRKAFEHITGEIVIIQDADLEYYPDEYPALIQKIQEGKADVVYGTRFFGSRRVFHFYNYLGNAVLNCIANLLYDTNLSDLMTCYKAMKADVARSLKLRADGFGIEAEITAQIFKRRCKVYEVPISYDGRDYDEGKKICWKDFFRSLYCLIRCRFETYDVGGDTLYRMRMMQNNNRWVFEQMRPYIGSTIAEIGSGIGTISKYFAVLGKNLVLTDTNTTYLEYLRHRFIGNPYVKVLFHDIETAGPSAIIPFKVDTIVCVNVLEHIQNDKKTVENMYTILVKGGYLILVVPAFKRLYTPLDKALGHIRRYEKKELNDLLRQQNFTVEKMYYHNLVGAIGWYVNGRILRRRIMTRFQTALFDKFIPFLAMGERVISIPFGMSLIAICRKE